MKDCEIFSQLKVPDTAIVRVDGRRFGKVLRKLNFSKPFDIRFTNGMVESIELFFKKSGINPVLAFLFSDEISLLFMRNLPFNGRLEKIDSVIPSFISSALALNLDSPDPMSFDSRVSVIDSKDIIEYLIWRQEECWRNLVSSYAYYLLRDDGFSAKQAAERLKGLKSDDLHELAWGYGVNLSETPAWQRRGILVYKQKFEKDGQNLLTGEKTKAMRTQIVKDWEPPIFKTEEGSRMIESILQ
ncbi:MAG: tRNA 5'-guanylyltransferase [Methanosarcinales archaeon]|nr:tRNA 5'-guanylyltransferase [Methanosarcinales archaeon]